MSSNDGNLRVSARTEPNKLGGAIAKTLEERDEVTVMSVGAHATNQAVKGIIVARKYLSTSAKDLEMTPGFKTEPSTKLTDDDEITIIVFKLRVK